MNLGNLEPNMPSALMSVVDFQEGWWDFFQLIAELCESKIL